MSDLQQRNADAMLSTLTTLRGELSDVAVENRRMMTTIQQLSAEVQILRQQVAVLSIENRGHGSTTK